MRILLMVMFGFILAACGQDYEEVYGVKIGAPISKVEGIEEYDFIESCDLTLWSKEPIDKLGIRTILAVDGEVVGVVINENESEFEDRISDAKRKYGDPLEKGEINKFATFKSKNDLYWLEIEPKITTHMTKSFRINHEEMAYGCE